MDTAEWPCQVNLMKNLFSAKKERAFWRIELVGSINRNSIKV